MPSKYGGYMGRVLDINVSTRETGEYPWEDEDREKYLGGKIMAAKIIHDLLSPDTDPYDPENPLVITTGPLTGSASPSSSRFNVSSRSPLTGLLGSSNCGGTFGLHLKKAGYDGVVIRGRSEKPVWIQITEDEVLFHDATDLWGMKTGPVQEKLKGKGKLVIGPAGENRVRYAAIMSGDRAAGRTGMGAVMGSKNIKAITASGTQSTPVKKADRLKKHIRSWTKLLKKHPLTGEALPKYGTANLVRAMQRGKKLATRNYSRGQFDDYDKVSGETLAEKYLIKNTGCVSCPIHCSRLVEVNGKKVKGPELETISLLGPNLENSDLEAILRWNYELDELGMDTISAAGSLGFAMELNEKGLWDNGLEFGKTENISEILEDIAYRRGHGDMLAEGTRRMAEKFGGKEFAINVKGLELAAYEPRGAVGLGLGYATANRGACHLNAGYVILLEGLGLGMNPYTPRAKAALNVMFQNLMESISAGGNCLFTLYTANPGFLIRHQNNPISKLVNAILGLSGPVINLFVNYMPPALMPLHLPMIPHTKALTLVTGMNLHMGKMKEIGERGYNLERIVNLRLGLTGDEDRLPSRLTDEEQVPGDSRTKVPLEPMKKQYYHIRGWDENGRPTLETLQRLKLVL